LVNRLLSKEKKGKDKNGNLKSMVICSWIVFASLCWNGFSPRLTRRSLLSVFGFQS
jgi:hypothetical protein